MQILHVHVSENLHICMRFKGDAHITACLVEHLLKLKDNQRRATLPCT
jgi:hypothetical protein